MKRERKELLLSIWYIIRLAGWYSIRLAIAAGFRISKELENEILKYENYLP